MDFLGDLVGDVIADKVGSRLSRLNRRGQAGGPGCALRITDGRHDGLSRHWRSGTAEPAPGRLVFRQRHTSYAVVVTGAGDTGGQITIPSLGLCGIARLTTPAGTLELAMPHEQLALAVRELTRDTTQPAAPGA